MSVPILPSYLPQALCVLLWLGADADRRAALHFNNTLAGYGKKLLAPGLAFGKAIGPALKGRAVDLGEVRRAYRQARAAVSAVKKGLARLPVSNADSARQLAEGYHRYLMAQDRALENLAEVLGLLEAANPPDRAGQRRLARIVDMLARREQKHFDELQRLQRAFLKVYRIPLEPGKAGGLPKS